MPGGKPSAADDVLLGVVLSAHGLKGEVKVKTFTDKPASLGAYGPLVTDDGRQLVIAQLKPTTGDQVVVRLEGISERNGAENLRGQKLYVPRAALPKPEDGEFYEADLVGLTVENADGETLGTVKGVHNFGAGEVVEIEAADGASDFVPFTEDAVPLIDLANRRIVVVPPREAED